MIAVGLYSKMEKSNIVVTGGCGFIGTHLVNQLSKYGNHKIWIIDCLHPQVHGSENAEFNFPGNVVFVKGDIRDPNDVKNLFEAADPNILFHLAAETGTGQSMDEISRYCSVNVQGTACILESILKYSPNLKKVVLPSSRAVYGEGAYINNRGRTVIPTGRDRNKMLSGDFKVYDTNDNVLRPMKTPETVCPRPISIYASTKLMQEHLLEQAGREASWNVTILRLQNVYGPGQSLNNPYTGVISIFSSKLINRKRLNIYEDGEITRDFVFVQDVVLAFTRVLRLDLPHGTVINIGTGQPTTIMEMANLLMKLFGVNKDSFDISGEFRDGDIRHAVADNQRAVDLLGWTPGYSVEEGIKEILASINV